MVRKTAFYGSILFLYLITISGCAKDYLDPTKIGRFREVPAQNIILDTLWVGDEPDPTWAGAEDPRPEDLVAIHEDYVFGTGDLIGISIFELLQDGLAHVANYQITESGKVSIPDVRFVQAEGLTEIELENKIRYVLKGGETGRVILLNPSVSVTLQQSEKLIYSISGDGVQGDGQYRIPRYDFRLSRALAVAGGVEQFNVSYIYVTRRINDPVIDKDTAGVEESTDVMGGDVNSGDAELDDILSSDGMTPSFEDSNFEAISPSISDMTAGSNHVLTMDVIDNDLEALAAPEGIGSKTVKKEGEASATERGATEWVFQNGKWIRIKSSVKPAPEKKPEVKPAVKPVQPAQPKFEEIKPEERASYGWEEIGSGGTHTRVIKIPRGKLFGGDPKYDIIIHPNDSIHVPVDIVGEFFVTGELNSRGAIPLTGRPVTLKQAIAMAGGLSELAWPNRVEIIRRVGENKEITVMVDLVKIASGEQPDFFIKPYDLINVGTHGSARYLAVLREAFTARYGFGFTYDRNFAYSDRGQYSGF